MKKQPIVSSTKKQIPSKSKSYSYLALLPMLLLSIFANAASVQWQTWPDPQQALGAPEVVSAQAMDATNVPTGQMIIYASMTPDVCMAAGDAITAQKSGTCTIMASIDDNSASEYQSWQVTKAPATMSLSFLPSVYVGESVAITATVPGNLPVTLSVLSANCDIDGSMSIKALSAGACSFTAASVGDDVYESAVANGSFNISKKSQTLDIVAPTASIFDELFGVSATASSGLTPVSIAPSGGCGFDDGSSTENSAQLVSTAAGSCTVTFTQAGNNEFAEVVGTRTVTIAKADQAITIIEGIPGYGTINVDYPVSAEADSGLPVAITVSGDCIKVGNYVRPKTPAAGSGTCTVSYKQVGNSNYNPADMLTEEMTVQVGQTINITQALPISGKFDDKVQTAATTTSGLPVHISVSGGSELDPAPAGTDSHVLSTAGVHLTAIGVCTVTYSQPGGEIGGVWYDEAPSLSRSVTVDKWTQNIVITRQPPAAEQAGLAVVVEAIAEPTDAENPRGVTISVAAGSSCTVLSSEDNIATIKLNTTGSNCTIYFNQAGNQLYKPAPQLSRTITISQVTDGSNIGNYWPRSEEHTSEL